MQHARAAQRDLPRQQRYRAGRPTVERKISHFHPLRLLAEVARTFEGGYGR